MICIFSYCCLYFYLPYLLLNIYDGNDAFWRQSMCSSNSSAPLAGNTGFYLSRSVSAKQSGWPGNPVDYRIWRLMQECVYIVQDTCPRHQRLDAAHQWHMGKPITKRRNCWSVKKVVMCRPTRDGKRASLWTSAKLKPALFIDNTLHNRVFSKPPTVYRGNLRPFHRSYLIANKICEREGIRKVEYAYYFWKCADAVCQKLSRLFNVCRNYSLPKLARFLRRSVLLRFVFQIISDVCTSLPYAKWCVPCIHSNNFLPYHVNFNHRLPLLGYSQLIHRPT